MMNVALMLLGVPFIIGVILFLSCLNEDDSNDVEISRGRKHKGGRTPEPGKTLWPW